MRGKRVCYLEKWNSTHLVVHGSTLLPSKLMLRSSYLVLYRSGEAGTAFAWVTFFMLFVVGPERACLLMDVPSLADWLIVLRKELIFQTTLCLFATLFTIRLRDRYYRHNFRRNRWISRRLEMAIYISVNRLSGSRSAKIFAPNSCFFLPRTLLSQHRRSPFSRRNLPPRGSLSSLDPVFRRGNLWLSASATVAASQLKLPEQSLRDKHGSLSVTGASSPLSNDDLFLRFAEK